MLWHILNCLLGVAIILAAGIIPAAILMWGASTTV